MPGACVFDVNRHLRLVFRAQVGEGQLASVVVNKTPAQQHDGHFHLELGSGESWKNRELEIEATLVRANQQTDRASLTFVLYQYLANHPEGPDNLFGRQEFPIAGPLSITFAAGEEQRLIAHTISLL